MLMNNMCLSPMFYTVMAIRKFFIALCLIFLNDFPIANLVTFMILNVLSSVFDIKEKPFTNKIFLIREIVKESSFFLIHILSFPILCMSSENLSEVIKSNLGGAIIFFCCVIVVAYLGV